MPPLDTFARGKAIKSSASTTAVTIAGNSASKFAVTDMSDALCNELAPFSVDVSVLFPVDAQPHGSGDTDADHRLKTQANMMEPIWLSQGNQNAEVGMSALLLMRRLRHFRRLLPSSEKRG